MTPSRAEALQAPNLSRPAIAFSGFRAVATGDLAQVAAEAKPFADDRAAGPLLVFDAVTGDPVEIDFRGTVDQVRARVAAAVPQQPARAPGRPRLGVVGREVTLLPRHWEWLSQQRGGASAALRRLVEDAVRGDSRGGVVRTAREATYRFMSHIAGDLPRFEAASRALFAGDRDAFRRAVADWPADVRDHAIALSVAAFG